MGILESLLSPLIWVMDLLLSAGISIIDSAGASILLLSLICSIALYPVQRWAYRIENRFLDKSEKVKSDLTSIDSSLKGESRFLAEERVFKKHSYHPIQQLCVSMSIVVALPVLIAAIFLFDNNADLQGVSFSFIRDLSVPDGLAAGFNLMPFILFATTSFDAFIRFQSSRSTLIRFLLISIVLLILVYPLPAALILYWMGNNLVSMMMYHIRKIM